MTEEASTPPDEQLVAEFRAARQNFEAALAKVVESGALRLKPALEAACGVGEVCHGGKF